MAIKTISQFDAATPASNDKILFEQNGEGKSATLAELPIPTKVQSKLDTKINYTDSLPYEEIMASTDLSGKVASASALKNIISRGLYHEDGKSLSVVINRPCLIVIRGDGNDNYYIGMIARSGYSNIVKILSNNIYDSKLSYNKSTGTLSLPTGGWYEVIIV